MEFKNEITKVYGIRKSWKQKSEFRKYVVDLAKQLGYDVTIEKSVLAKNIIIGNPKTAKFIVGAHYDTPPQMPKFFIRHLNAFMFGGVPLISLLPHLFSSTYNQQTYKALTIAVQVSLLALTTHLLGLSPFANKNNFNDNSSGVLAILNLMLQSSPDNKNVAFVLFDNEEKGKLGALAYKAKHKMELKNQRVLIFDCIGRGDVYNFYAKHKNKLAETLMEELNKTEENSAKFKKSNLFSMSDHVPLKGTLVLANYNKGDNSLKYIHNSDDAICDDKLIDNLVDHVLKLEHFNEQTLEKDISK